MQAILDEANRLNATDIVLIQNHVWYRVLDKLQPSTHQLNEFIEPSPSRTEVKSSSHLRCLPNNLQADTLQYPSEVALLTKQTRGLILLSGPQGSGKTTLLLHCLQGLPNRSVHLEIPLPHSYLENVLLSSDQADVRVQNITDGTSAIEALRNSVHQLVIATIATKHHADTLRHLTMLLKEYPKDSVLSLMSEQIVSLVNINLIHTVQNTRRPLVSIINNNESIRSQISEGRFHKLEDSIQRGNSGLGSLSTDVQLAEWLRLRQIALDEALNYAIYPATMRLRASGIIHND